MPTRKVTGSASIVPHKTTTMTSTPAKQAGVDHQDSGEDSDEHASVDGDPPLDPVSMLVMQKQMRVMQKQLARMTSAPSKAYRPRLSSFRTSYRVSMRSLQKRSFVLFTRKALKLLGLRSSTILSTSARTSRRNS